MKKCTYRIMLLALAFTAMSVLSANSAVAQGTGTSSPSRTANVATSADNLDLQLYALVASNTAGESGTVPSSLNSLAREIRTTFQVSQVRVAAILQHRVENNGRLEVSGMANSILTHPSALPSFTTVNYGYSIASIKVQSESGRPMVQLAGVRFTLTLPFQTGSVKVGETMQPTIDHKSIGITTGVTLPFGEPAIIGSFTVGKVDEVVVLVMVARPVKER